MSYLERLKAARSGETAEGLGRATVAQIAPGPALDPVGVRARLAERAAIVEEGARVPRTWAERFARLCAAPAPEGVSAREWRAVLDGAGRFLDAWGANAHALGWTAAELFSLDPNAPLARLDRRGPAFMLADKAVIGMTADAITVRTAAGHVQRYVRHARKGLAPAWERVA